MASSQSSNKRKGGSSSDNTNDNTSNDSSDTIDLSTKNTHGIRAFTLDSHHAGVDKRKAMAKKATSATGGSGSSGVMAKMAISSEKRASMAIVAGKAAECKADVTTAIGHYRDAITAHRYSVDGHLRLAKALHTIAADDAAITEVERLLRVAIDNARQPMLKADELESGASARDLLGLLLCQQKRDDEARVHLQSCGYKYRLSSHVLAYAPPPATDAATPTTAASSSDSKNNASDTTRLAAVLDNVLSPSMLSHFQTFFAPSSLFWSEHRYHDPCTGYFSYLHTLSSPPRNSIEQVIAHIYTSSVAQFPQLRDARVAEWWCHSRPHSSGHQMHFDSDDEGRGGIRNPIISTVLYVTGDIGGPTFVTNQKLGGLLADQGWMIYPRTNRLALFDGKYLHGVVPGRGASPATSQRRMTFMVAFWPEILTRPPRDGDEQPGSARPLPEDGKTRYTWINTVPLRPEWSPAATTTTTDNTTTKSSSSSSSSELSLSSQTLGQAHGIPEVWQAFTADDAASMRVKLPGYEECHQGF